MSDDPASEEEEAPAPEEEEEEVSAPEEEEEEFSAPEEEEEEAPEVASTAQPLPDEVGMEAFSQGDLDRLVGGATPVEGVESVFRHNGELFDNEVEILSFDFRNPVFLTDKEINQVRARNEKFAFYLGQNLSMELRMNIDFAATNIAVQQYAQFTHSIESPSHVSLFKINELTGVGIMEINPVLALGMVDRALGGKGVAGQEPRFLTAIESTMVDDVAQVIVDEWCHQWDGYMELSGQVIGQETTGRFLQTSLHDSAVVVLTLDVSLGEIKESMRIGIPYYTITPILTRIQEATQKANKATDKEGGVPWKSTYNNINVQVNSEWDLPEKNVQELLEMQVGDFMELSPSKVEETRVRIAGKDCFLGEYGKEGEGMAVEIKEKLTS